MFEEVRGESKKNNEPLAVSTVVSVVVHVALVVFAVWMSLRPPEEKPVATDVTFFAAPPPPPPPPPPAGTTAQVERKVEQKKRPQKKPDTLVRSKDPEPEQKPEEPEPTQPETTEAEPQEGGQPGGVEGGVVGGVEGGVVGGVIGGVHGGQLGGQLGGVLAFGEGMTRPERLSGRDPAYTREAMEARVEGLMIVKCVITVQGRLENCRIIKPLPHMENAVLDALKSHRYKPVMYQGRPVTVDYVFNIRLVMPNR